MVEYHFVGIDVAKDKFDVALKVNHRFIDAQFKNDESGYQEFLAWLKERVANAFVCLEATGLYGERLAEFLEQEGIRVSVVNPMQIKHYAKSLLSRNKNDRVDAKIIASYAEQFMPRCFVSKSPEQKFAREAVQLIDTLGRQKRQLENQVESIRSKEIKKEVECLIESIEKRIFKLEKVLKACIKNHPKYYEDQQHLLSIVGIGEKTANRMIAYFPDISEFKNAKQLAAYVGVSPKQHQSGKYYGKTRLSKYGNPQLRKALYMPALVAKNKNPSMREFCKRLEKNGLKPKQIICAVMRKLIHIIFGVLKHKQNFNPALT